MSKKAPPSNFVDDELSKLLYVKKLLQRLAGRLRTVAELKVTHTNIIGHNTIHHCSLEFNYEQVVVTNSSTSPSTYLQISVYAQGRLHTDTLSIYMTAHLTQGTRSVLLKEIPVS